MRTLKHIMVVAGDISEVCLAFVLPTYIIRLSEVQTKVGSGELDAVVLVRCWVSLLLLPFLGIILYHLWRGPLTKSFVVTVSWLLLMIAMILNLVVSFRPQIGQYADMVEVVGASFLLALAAIVGIAAVVSGRPSARVLNGSGK